MEKMGGGERVFIGGGKCVGEAGPFVCLFFWGVECVCVCVCKQEEGTKRKERGWWLSGEETTTRPPKQPWKVSSLRDGVEDTIVGNGQGMTSGE